MVQSSGSPDQEGAMDRGRRYDAVFGSQAVWKQVGWDIQATSWQVHAFPLNCVLTVYVISQNFVETRIKIIRLYEMCTICRSDNGIKNRWNTAVQRKAEALEACAASWNKLKPSGSFLSNETTNGSEVPQDSLALSDQATTEVEESSAAQDLLALTKDYDSEGTDEMVMDGQDYSDIREFRFCIWYDYVNLHTSFMVT